MVLLLGYLPATDDPSVLVKMARLNQRAVRVAPRLATGNSLGLLRRHPGYLRLAYLSADAR
ncbi:hypothetical protein ACVBEG_15080 [Pseudomonas sp. GG8]